MKLFQNIFFFSQPYENPSQVTARNPHPSTCSNIDLQVPNVEAVRTNLSKMNNYATFKSYQPSYLFAICNLSSSGQPFSARFNRQD